MFVEELVRNFADVFGEVVSTVRVVGLQGVAGSEQFVDRLCGSDRILHAGQSAKNIRRQVGIARSAQREDGAAEESLMSAASLLAADSMWELFARAVSLRDYNTRVVLAVDREKEQR